MKTRSTVLVLSTLLIVTLTGCVGTGPYTQNYSVGGAALGSIAGAVISHNSGGNTLGGAAIGALAGAVVGGTMGNVQDHQNGTVYAQSYPIAYAGYSSPVAYSAPVAYVPAAPAPLVDAVVVAPGVGYVWIPGFYNYGPYGYAWIGGHWGYPPFRGARYFSPRWIANPRGRGYVWHSGGWRR